MAKPGSIKKLLTSSAKVATLVCVGVAETACNLIVAPAEDTGPVDSSVGTDAPSSDAPSSDTPSSDAPSSDAASDAPSSDAGSKADAGPP